MEQLSISLYADDVKIFRTIVSPWNASFLQLDLISLSQWSTENGLSLNSSKCNVLSFHRSRQCLEYDYVVQGQSLTRVSAMTDLGIVFSSNLTFSDHIQSCTAKALRLLGFIFRMSVEFCDSSSLRHLFQILVLPHLTHGSVNWTPYTQTHARPLESILHRLLRMLAFKNGQPMYFTDHDYSRLMTSFDLLPIISLHTYYDAIFAYKSLNDLIHSRELNSLFSTRNPPYPLRQFNILSENSHASLYAFNSSLPKLRRLWNLMPVVVQLLPDSHRFKTRVSDLLRENSSSIQNLLQGSSTSHLAARSSNWIVKAVAFRVFPSGE